MLLLEISTCENISILATLLFLKKIIKILSIIVPIILVVLITIDIGKAIVEGDDEAMKHAQSISTKRIIAALIVFFVPIIIDASFSLIGNQGVVGLSCYANATDENVDKLMKIDKDKQAKQEKENNELKEKTKKLNKNVKEKQKDLRKKGKELAKKTNADNVKNTGNTYKSKTKLDKSYSSIKILDTLTKKDFEILSTVKATNNIKIAQSFAVVNNYYVVINVNTFHTKAYVGVYDKHTNKKVNSFNTSLGHANGATYNEKDNNVYVTHGDFSRTKVHKLSAANIEFKNSISVKNITVSRGVSGVAYDDVTGKLYYASGNNIYEYRNGSLIHKVTRRSFTLGTSQDFCVHNGIVYDLRLNGGNTIDIYKVSGAYLGSYRVKINNHEIESIDYYGESDKIAVLFNQYGNKNNYIYVIDSIMPH